MVQGGGFTPDMQQKETDGNIENEAKNGLKNGKGSIAMARTPNPHSASSQFFINLKDNSFLDYPGQDGWGYCVFGKVSKGQEVVDAMAAVQRPVLRGVKVQGGVGVTLEADVGVSLWRGNGRFSGYRLWLFTFRACIKVDGGFQHSRNRRRRQCGHGRCITPQPVIHMPGAWRDGGAVM